MHGRTWSSLFIRLGLGIVMSIHGAGKLFGIGPVATPIPEFTQELVMLGLPGAAAWAWLVGLVEFGGGVLIVLGLLTRYAGLAIALDMLGAIVLVHLPRGFAYTAGGYEFAFVLCVMALSLVVGGPGAFSVAYTLFGEELYWPQSSE